MFSIIIDCLKLNRFKFRARATERHASGKSFSSRFILANVLLFLLSCQKRAANTSGFIPAADIEDFLFFRNQAFSV